MVTQMVSDKETIAAKVPQDTKDEIDEIAYNLSSPSETVSTSDLIRHSLSETFGISTTSLNKDPKTNPHNSEPSCDSDGKNNGKESEESEGLYRESPANEPSDISDESETEA